ncbi:N-alpha-acetyltransferase 40 [Tetranychus urticae]|uniref:N-alpha-acetyltransferase 40 n=1 Tax=Tetranychus urticae TaxID=32264 RepID=A0A158P5E6_TETUR|nr:N-alpha-acetyltransferase 40 [Tetranychus urticae]
MPPNKSKISRGDALKKVYSNRIQKAYETSDHLNLIDQQLCTRLSGYSLKLYRSTEIDKEYFEWMINLIQTNMENFYKTCAWGWNKSQKEKELKHAKAMILIAINSESNKPVGFTHFRFDYDEDGARGVIYCYELQIEADYQRKGLGAWLMDVLSAFCIKFEFPKLMLTCLKHNRQAMNFYRNNREFMIDRRSPSKCGENTCYEILSKKILPS